ncbi:prepilin-type N-terminal cleavage/methylation domain-containing protein [Acinetobacter dispersus]|uniref:type IV pilin protein n=1 Tax=Acinetobacter dispersus TaxID=70348 RepID=UPI001F4B34C3|nr:prepilin-type N-terminal cleavage/methylation domain-containing protein [Acinetobacter dispersus]MCH7394493.1 prepilin-type N-terminal cleavage/methylation domain-containing protein [Acinetobacter dispersus]
MLNKSFISYRGFTLIELMVVVVLVAIATAIAIASYQAYAYRAIAAQAQQVMQLTATELERSKTRNFNYLGFQTTPSPIVLPAGVTGSAIQYTIQIGDGSGANIPLTAANAAGQSWVMLAIWKAADPMDTRNYSFLMTSSGLRCKNKTKANITAANIGNATCGVGREEW